MSEIDRGRSAAFAILTDILLYYTRNFLKFYGFLDILCLM